MSPFVLVHPDSVFTNYFGSLTCSITYIEVTTSKVFVLVSELSK